MTSRAPQSLRVICPSCPLSAVFEVAAMVTDDKRAEHWKDFFV